MKKIYTFFTLILLVAFANAETITKTYYFDNPVIEQKGDYHIIGFENCLQTAKIGEPTLPYFAVKLLLPPGEESVSISVELEEEVTLAGEFKLFPYQSSKPLSQSGENIFQINNELYQSNKNYPFKQHGKLSTHYLHGHSIAMTTITPIAYNPASGKISYFKKVTIIIETNNTDKAQKALVNLHTDKKIDKYIDNPELIKKYQSRENRTDDPYKLLIITPETFASAFDTLRNIYLSRGIKSELITPNYIDTHMSGQDVQEKIRNYIIQEYQESDIEYVILGGDIQHVPYRGFYCYVQSGSGYETNDIPSDLYYSALDGTWNDNGNNYWGEPNEDDLLPELAVARFPFGDINELNNIIHKSINYQNLPVLGEFTNNLLAGESLYSNPETWGRDYLNLIIGERNDNGYTTIGIPDNYTIDSIYEHDAPWNGSTLMAQINSGKQFVHHAGHANVGYVAHLNYDDITNANFSGANGIDHNYTLLQTHGCDCGAFDANCILEKMVTIENFAVSVIGNSRFGWFNEGQTEGPAAHLHREMVDALYYEKINHLGKAFKECKIQTAPWVEAAGQWEEGALRWNFYDLNILGDPVLSVWTDEPISIEVDYEEFVNIGSTSTTVVVTNNGIPVENFACTILKEGILHATSLTDATGTATLEFDPIVDTEGMGSLIVTGYNCLPDTNSITFISSQSAYVVYNSHEISDPDGNNNAMADFGESIMLNFAIMNAGQAEATNVIATIAETNDFFTITDSYENYGTIAAGDSNIINEAFAIDIAPDVPDQSTCIFELICESEGETWASSFSIVANAPVPQIENLEINDETGNNNGYIDPGETAVISITVINNGNSDCPETIIELTCNNSDVTFNESIINLGIIAAADTATALFEVTAGNNIYPGTFVEFYCEANMCNYIDSITYYNTIGNVMEDFETGDFTAFRWYDEGDMPWTISTVFIYNGNFSAKSGAISDIQSSSLAIDLIVHEEGELSFARKVMSEPDLDKLGLYINNELIDSWSGNVDWGTESYTIEQGYYTIRWTYEKDINASSGFDCALLDDIIFPPSTVVTEINKVNNEPVNVYPNPGNGLFNILCNKQNITLKVYNSTGILILEENINCSTGRAIFDISKHPDGIYFVEFDSGNSRAVGKIVKK